ALLNGAALVLVNREILASGEELVNKMAQEKVTTVTLPPSVLAVFPKTELPHLQTIITAGEKCTTELVKNWAPGRKFFNAYGPTETTVCASMYLTDPEEEQAPPIGRPIGNFQLYILDRHWRPVPIGVPGELCVGGVGLARGYLNRPDLTAEKFIPNPFSDRGERLYRTGDLVRYKPDGNIEFLGRIDYQVKVRGFRIELGEIEANLNEYPGVRDVAVLAREDQPGQKQLVAYLVADEENKPSPAELRDHLKERLPDYMIPAAYVFLDAMPLTPNGKVDRRRLPAPDMEAAVLRREYVAPRNETEEKLTAIVAQLLNLEKVGVYDNFFELGGHSLLATQFISRVKEEFEVELPLITLFEKPTIEQMALAVQEAKLVSKAPAKPQIKRIARDSRRVRRSDLQQRSGKKPDNNEPQGKPGE
ncbi:MAG TPA: non-ribosomal peptide synthetase, partial [Caldithrix abyssi]|nr:non-ribosomal peptide synthetase [Caldithrix abyssi]